MLLEGISAFSPFGLPPDCLLAARSQSRGPSWPTGQMGEGQTPLASRPSPISEHRRIESHVASRVSPYIARVRVAILPRLAPVCLSSTPKISGGRNQKLPLTHRTIAFRGSASSLTILTSKR